MIEGTLIIAGGLAVSALAAWLFLGADDGADPADSVFFIEAAESEPQPQDRFRRDR